MSERFGLDWKEYEYARMKDFVDILYLESEKQKKDAKKTEKKNKFRPRGG